jgi:16S rRNA processing protein RimM
VEVVVGRIGRPHGIKGEVTVEVRTDDPEGRLGPGAVVRTDPEAAGPLTVTGGHVHSGRLLLTFAGVADRGAAEALRGVLLVAEVDPDERLEDPEEFYDHQLVGLAVETVDGRPVGELVEMLHLPGQDVLAVRRPDGGEVLVPFVTEIVPTVDLDGHKVIIDPPPGLLDPDATE